jgi:hypothetical protein
MQDDQHDRCAPRRTRAAIDASRIADDHYDEHNDLQHGEHSIRMVGLLGKYWWGVLIVFLPPTSIFRCT